MDYKDFIMILSSYKCNKNCPYCIAKIERLPEIKEDLIQFKNQIDKLIQDKARFKYFVLSGNGEPSYYTYEFLKEIVSIVTNSGIFEDYRIQTSGRLFHNDKLFYLFKDWLIEITRVSEYYDVDSSVLHYKNDYTLTKNFHNARIRLNYVLLKGLCFVVGIDILEYLNKYKNIETVALKILDSQENHEDEYTKWILANGETYTNIDIIEFIMNNHFKYLGYKFNNHIWDHNGKQISMFSNKNYNKDKTIHNLVWYGNKIIY